MISLSRWGREENQRVSGSGGKIGGEGGKDAYRPRLEEEVVPRAALESARSFPKFPECPFTFTTATGIWEVIWVKVA